MKYKKILCTVPMIMMLSTPVVMSPITALAAEKPTTNTASQVNSVKGYLYKNGVKSTLYKDQNMQKSGPVSTTPGLPTLPANPLDGLPSEGTTVSETGDMGDVLYFEGESKDGSKLPDGGNGKFYLKKRSNHNNDIEYGMYDPKTYKLYPSNPEELIYGPEKDFYKSLQDQTNQMFGKAFDGQTKVKRETRYKLVGSLLEDSSTAGTFNHTLVSGLNVTDQFGFSATLGWRISATEGGSVVPASVTQEMSGSLTTTYGHSITVTSSESIGKSVSVGKVDNPKYKYDQYMMAGYQLKSKYSVIPGDGLKAILKEQSQLKGLASSVYQYNQDVLYVGVTPDSHLNG